MPYTATIDLGENVQNLDIATPLEPYTGVRLIVGVDDDGNELTYVAGSESGRVLEVENPLGSQSMANAIFESVRGYSYTPTYVDGAALDPAAEIGDGIKVNDVYSGIFTRATTFGTLMLANISAPTDEEVVHEFNIPTPEERRFERVTYDMKSELKLTSTQIEAKVSKTSPTGQTAFGWNLQDNQWTVFNQSGNILRATSAGLEVTGKIQANEGYIGGANGFTIKASAIYNGIAQLGDGSERGVYIGTDGIQIGQGFKADSYGSVAASNLRLNGGSIEIGVAAPQVAPISKDGFVFYQWAYEQNGFSTPYIVYEENQDQTNTYITVSRVLLDSRTVLPSTAYSVNNRRIDFDATALSGIAVGSHTVEIIGQITLSDGVFDWEPFDFDLTSPSLTISAPVQRTFFRVDQSGNVTASSLNITGGTISIGNKFFVDANGNLTANDGYFRGHVSAGNVDWGGDDGFFDGAGLLDESVWGGSGGAISAGSIDTGVVDEIINASLGYANFADSVFNGWDTATWGKFTFLDVQGYDFEPATISYKTQTGANASMVVLAVRNY